MSLLTAISTAVLAVITGVYVWLVNKTLNETKKMAEATQVMAKSSVRPDLTMALAQYGITLRYAISNKGPGPAFNVKVTVGGEGVSGVPDTVPPGSPTGNISGLQDAWDKRLKVCLSCTDILGEAYNFWWVYDGHVWAPTTPE